MKIQNSTIQNSTKELQNTRKNSLISTTEIPSNSSPTFGKLLSHVDKTIRDAAVKSLIEYLSTQSNSISQLQLLKLWKGLYYCFWMSDKPLIQQHLATTLASIPLSLPYQLAFSFISAFWTTIIREWHGIDRLRIDKYYFLLRQFHQSSFKIISENSSNHEMVYKYTEIIINGPLSASVPLGLRYHTIDSFVDEAINAKVYDNHLFYPIFHTLQTTKNKILFDKILNEIFQKILSLQVESTDTDNSMTFDNSFIVTILETALRSRPITEHSRITTIIKSFNDLGFNSIENNDLQEFFNYFNVTETSSDQTVEISKPNIEIQESPISDAVLAPTLENKKKRKQVENNIPKIHDVTQNMQKTFNTDSIKDETEVALLNSNMDKSKKRKKVQKLAIKAIEKKVIIDQNNTGSPVSQPDLEVPIINDEISLKDQIPTPVIKKKVQWKSANEIKTFNKKVAIALPFSKSPPLIAPGKSALKQSPGKESMDQVPRKINSKKTGKKNKKAGK